MYTIIIIILPLHNRSFLKLQNEIYVNFYSLFPKLVRFSHCVEHPLSTLLAFILVVGFMEAFSKHISDRWCKIDF